MSIKLHPLTLHVEPVQLDAATVLKRAEDRKQWSLPATISQGRQLGLSSASENLPG